MLDTRKENILKLIVEEYIKNIRPVGSKSICDTLNVSSATVRNEMMALENEGYLEKTHTSSGRVPSEKGYRYYVDHIMKPKDITGEDMLKLQTIFSNNQLALSNTIEKSLSIISEMTNYTAVVLENKGINDDLQQVSILPISEDKIVALVVTSSGHVENKTIDIKNPNLEDVQKIVELINKLIVGTPINEVSSKLEFEIKPIIGQYIMNYEMVYSAFYNAFNGFKDNNQDEVIIKGRDKILQLPEFNNVNDIKKVISALDEEKIKHLKEESEDINIYIGKENELDENLSVIKTKIGDSTLAIVGPKRMDYDFVVGLMEYIKNNIER